ncbi:hypothetical protein CPB86DRAFT_803021 [Serendipita vermifera]|nr:hypothetical protein CPB86DRAFT_803021 [Serendipita vermifera]
MPSSNQNIIRAILVSAANMSKEDQLELLSQFQAQMEPEPMDIDGLNEPPVDSRVVIAPHSLGVIPEESAMPNPHHSPSRPPEILIEENTPPDLPHNTSQSPNIEESHTTSPPHNHEKRTPKADQVTLTESAQEADKRQTSPSARPQRIRGQRSRFRATPLTPSNWKQGFTPTVQEKKLSDDLYYKVKSGEVNIWDAMGPDWVLESDPDKDLLIHKPRNPKQIAFAAAVRWHYELLIEGSLNTFPYGIITSLQAQEYDLDTNPPSATHFAIDWNTDIGSEWNLACRNFFAANFVLHIKQYQNHFDLPSYATNQVTVFDQFSQLLKVIRTQVKQRESWDDNLDTNVAACQKRHNDEKQAKYHARLETCRSIGWLQDYFPLVSDIGLEGISDEETDDERQKTSNGACCTKVLRLRYRSEEYKKFMRLLDAIKQTQEDATSINFNLTQAAKRLKKRVAKIDTKRKSRRNGPIGKPVQLYSEEYLQEAQILGKGLPPTLPEDLVIRMQIYLPKPLLEALDLHEDETECKTAVQSKANSVGVRGLLIKMSQEPGLYSNTPPQAGNRPMFSANP